jgi:hypothetical protein
MKPMRALVVTSLLGGFTLLGAAFAADSAAAVAVPTVSAQIKAPEMDGQGYLKLGFDQLAGYTFTPPAFDPAMKPNEKPATGEEQIPALVKSWSGKKVIVTGFMLPVKMDKGLVTEFLLVRNQMACCYGSVPNMNEWVIVKVKKGVQPLMDVPIQFYGQLKVGATFDNGYMTGLYELAGERLGEVGPST